ncbi:MAG: peptidoglycan DD-metalloendopeptidase family protein [Peptococcaceae bacterium]|nr:peptidoglycan DD-metalloendopeptidase family protein [Peptococcaceae bacterium]
MYRSPFIKAAKLTKAFDVKGTAWAAGRHTGEDYIPKDGTIRATLVSPASGTVLDKSFDDSYGHKIIIRTTDSKVILMAHMESKSTAGNTVVAGNHVGIMGDTGNGSGHHLHIEVQNSTTWKYNSNLLRPSLYIDFGNFSGAVPKVPIVGGGSYSTGNYMVTASSGINVRVDAGTGYAVKGSATKGTIFAVSKITSNGTWGYTSSIQCTNGKQSGWLSLENCSPATTINPGGSGGSRYSTGNYVVTVSSGINVRVDAGTGYAVKGSATKGTRFAVSKIASNGTWGYTSSIQCTNGKQSGWLSLENCSPV